MGVRIMQYRAGMIGGRLNIGHQKLAVAEGKLYVCTEPGHAAGLDRNQSTMKLRSYSS